MRILHTADWHLGKKLYHYSRLEEQKEVLKEIVQIAKSKSVDVILVAGDLFDTFNPSNDATELLYKTLKNLARNAQVPVIAIAGNHDSPDRINVADVLARESGIIFIGHPTDVVKEFEIEGGFKVNKSEVGFLEIELPKYNYPIRILHTAFANEVRLKEYFGQDKQASLQDSLQEKWQRLAAIYCDDQGVNVLTTHLFMQKRGGEKLEEPDGEKPLNIGNADLIYSDAIPESIQYAALGHLHAYQDVGIHQPVVYSSSPLQYSFSEAGQQKYVAVIDVEPGKMVEIERVPLASGQQLVRKTFTSVEETVSWLQENPNTLVELTIQTDEFLKAEERKQILQAHEGIIYMIPIIKNLTGQESTSHSIDLSKDIHALFVDYFKLRNGGQSPNEELIELFNEIKSAT